MNINIPTKQFERAFPPTLIGDWKRAFLRSVTKVLILHDRTYLAKKEPTNRNIVRAVAQGIRIGVDFQFFSKTDKFLTHPKKFPKDWEDLVTDETNRIMDEEELANKETV